MHCLTVCADPGDNVLKEYTERQLQRWKNGDGTYNIEVTLDEEQMDHCDYTIRRYVPHDSILDKLMYLLAVVIQHYNDRTFKGPVEPVRWSRETEESFEKRKVQYEKELKDWQKKGFHNANQKWLDEFEEKIKELEDSLSYRFHSYLFDGEKFDKDDPKVRVKLNYFIDKASDYILGSPVGEEKYFSTGCYGNEEFYHAVCEFPWRTTGWICNPFDQVLAGSDEQDEEDNMAQMKKAKELLEESWKLAKKAYEHDKHDLIMNPGKVIWPLGG